MNTQEYINSGIIEQYLFGNVSPQERQEVECMSHIYPEIKNELLSQQSAIEQYAMATQIAPPADLKAKILQKIKEQNKTADTQQTVNQPEVAISEDVVKKDNVIRMDEKPSGNSSFFRYLAAASVLFTIVLAGLSYYQFGNYKETLAQMSDDANGLKADMATMSQKMAIIQDPSYQKITMPGIKEKSPESMATIYWNQDKKSVYINTNNLPKHAPGHQFQLWAIKDGVPVSMGMIPQDFDSETLIKMEDIDKAEAFAITLEKKGGVLSPTMSEMYVMAAI